jgi:hypothetical protein
MVAMMKIVNIHINYYSIFTKHRQYVKICKKMRNNLKYIKDLSMSKINKKILLLNQMMALQYFNKLKIAVVLLQIHFDRWKEE